MYFSWHKYNLKTLKENNYLSLSNSLLSEALVQKAQGVTKITLHNVARPLSLLQPLRSFTFFQRIAYIPFLWPHITVVYLWVLWQQNFTDFSLLSTLSSAFIIARVNNCLFGVWKHASSCTQGSRESLLACGISLLETQKPLVSDSWV